MFDWASIARHLGVSEKLIADAQKVGYDLEQLVRDGWNESLEYVRLKIELLLHQIPDPNQSQKKL